VSDFRRDVVAVARKGGASNIEGGQRVRHLQVVSARLAGTGRHRRGRLAGVTAAGAGRAAGGEDKYPASRAEEGNQALPPTCRRRRSQNDLPAGPQTGRRRLFHVLQKRGLNRKAGPPVARRPRATTVDRRPSEPAVADRRQALCPVMQSRQESVGRLWPWC
jgi:hypothetical protein